MLVLMQNQAWLQIAVVADSYHVL